MGNTNVSGQQPLLSPGQLWGKTPPVSRPATPNPAPSLPATLPKLPSTLPPLGRDTLQTSAQPGSSLPQVSFTQTSPVNGSIGQQMQQLTGLMKSADTQLLGRYQLQVQKNDSGQITGYLLNGQPATAQQVQQYLLPHSGFLHQELVQLRQSVDQAVNSFYSQVRQQFPQLKPQEQTAVQIQLQAVQVVYENFVNRINQVDSLIK